MTSNSSSKEQMSLVLHFVDSEMNIREEFIAFLHYQLGIERCPTCKINSGSLNNFALPIEDCHGARV